MVEAVELVDGQRVHVGAQADGAVRIAGAQRADDAGLAQAAMDVEAPARELLGDDVGGAHLLEGDLGVPVYVAPDFDQLVMMLGDSMLGRHGCPRYP